MNNRPRQPLNWDSPYQAFQKFMAAIHEKTVLPFIEYQPVVLNFSFETAPPSAVFDNGSIQLPVHC